MPLFHVVFRGEHPARGHAHDDHIRDVLRLAQRFTGGGQRQLVGSGEIIAMRQVANFADGQGGIERAWEERQGTNTAGGRLQGRQGFRNPVPHWADNAHAGNEYPSISQPLHPSFCTFWI